MLENWVIEAEKLYKEGYSYTSIGKILNKNRQTISKHIKAIEKGEEIFNPNKLNSNMNINAFENIDTEEKAYWLGFMYADGYVSKKRNEVSFSIKELYHIERFKRFLNINNKIQKKIKDNKFVIYSISFRLKKIKEDLINNGCVPNKSKILVFPNEYQVPRNLLNHFIRGYIDGDGCITTSNNGKGISLEILGSKEFLLGLTKIDLFKINKLYSFNHSDIKRVSYSGSKAMNALKYIYNNATIYLERKYERYQKFMPSLVKATED